MRTPERRVRRGAAKPWRLAVILGTGAVLLWIAFCATFSQVAARTNPAVARALWPIAAEPQARFAEARLATQGTAPPSPDVLRAIKSQALRAMMRDPLNVAAARTAGLAAGLAGDDAGSRRLLGYAQTLSRRDLQTQIALMEYAVVDDDIAAALTHYDQALRTSDVADQLLMPVLIRAARDPEVAAALRPMLLQRPPWRLRFVYSLIEARPWSATFVPLLLSSRLSIGDPQELDFLRRALEGLVANNEMTQAAYLYAVARGTRPVSGIRNGDFARDDPLPPFDWSLADEPGLAALKGPVEGAPAGTVLSLVADGGRRDVIAKQLLLLPAGDHVLRYRFGAIPAEREAAPLLQLACAERPDRVIASTQAPPAPVSGRTAAVNLAVPNGCRAQWLTITPGAEGAVVDGISPWVGWLSIGKP